MTQGFLSRWSRRKHDSRRTGDERDHEAPDDERSDAGQPAPSAQPDAGTSAPSENAARSGSDASHVSNEAPPLPALESLTPQSDFRAFMQPGVDATTRNAALAQLFRDPRYNVMDGLDVYIDDYTRPDPIPPAMLAKLKQLHEIGLSDADSTKTAADPDPTEAQADPAAGDADAAQLTPARTATRDPIDDPMEPQEPQS
ncbi:MAG: DUF3306 domain-containing protein [Burkholderiaceae bacterium]|nr:DUF3306 domain-containing protein [Burkholderiaceae bacterium]